MMRPSRISLQVVGLLSFVTAVRVILSLQLELTSVESYHWVFSSRPAMGYYDHPGMVAWMGWLSMSLFGGSTLGVRAVTIAAGAAMASLVFLAGRRLYDERVGRLAAFIVALAPIFLGFAAELTPDAPCLLFWSATVWALAHALSGDSPRWWYAAGLGLGLAMDSKYHAIFLGLGIFGFLVFSPEQRGWLHRKEPWLAAVVALATFSPTLFWNGHNGWQSFAYQGVSRFTESSFQPDQLYKFPLNQLLLLTPAFCLWAWGTGIRTLILWRSSDWRDRLLAALGAPLLLFFLGLLFVRPIRGHWPMYGYVTTLILASSVVVRGGIWPRRLFLGTLGLLAAGCLAGPMAVGCIPLEKRSGWTQLTRRVALRKFDFVMCNDYHLASQLAYHSGSLEVWDLTPAGRPAKSFPHWWHPEDHLGKDAVIVYDSKHYGKEPDRVKAIEGSFERVGLMDEVAIPRFQLSGHDDPDRYMIYSAWNYRGPKTVERRSDPSED